MLSGKNDFLRNTVIFVLGSISLFAGSWIQPGFSSPGSRLLGQPAKLGNGSVASYAEFNASGTPLAIGVLFTKGALDNLPEALSGGRHCFDENKDGAIDVSTECARWHESVLPLPSEASRREDLPFKWVMLNWNSHGHLPDGIHDKPHFDVHFYIQSIDELFDIERGPCGPEKVRCDQFEKAKLPLPANYMHPDFKDVDAVAPAMGNHLVDLTAPQFHGVPFTRTWIYGSYGGRVTFFEEMVTLKYLKSTVNTCFPIKALPAVAITGYYPTQSCIRHNKNKTEYTVSMEAFQLRKASPPLHDGPTVREASEGHPQVIQHTQPGT